MNLKNEQRELSLRCFFYATSFNENIGSWNTANVNNMFGMFGNATLFNGDIGSWNTANVTDMAGMFLDASSFNQDIGGWTLKYNVTMTNMLQNSGMDCDHYSATLIDWRANNSTVTNMTGRLVQEFNTDYDYDICNIPGGVYSLRIESSALQINQKLVIMR